MYVIPGGTLLQLGEAESYILRNVFTRRLFNSERSITTYINFISPT